MAKRKVLLPTERQLAVLKILAAGGALSRRIAGTRMYQLSASYDEDGPMVDALTVSEVVALFRAGWIQDRENGDGANPRIGGEYIITEAGDELVEAAHG
ncbi:MAG TPA: hypothetical protein VD995_02815 [Azospirillum sp.]|nr:hypothetical protein [Azospirillum sp.]